MVELFSKITLSDKRMEIPGLRQECRSNKTTMNGEKDEKNNDWAVGVSFFRINRLRRR
jgi:hypothetical protein